MRFVHTNTGEDSVMATSLRSPPADATSLRMPRLSLVLNEKAGTLLAGGCTPDLTDRLAAGGAETRLIPPGDLPDRLRDACADADAVVVAGGDGTIACAAAALAGTGMPLGILPAGTMNLLAKDLRLPIGDLNQAADVILAGRTRDVDVGHLDGHVFLCACMLGAPTRLGHHRESSRHAGPWRQWVGFARAAFRMLRRRRSQRLTLTVDGATHRIKTPSLTITVNPVDDDHGRIFARSRLDGGRLCAYVIRRHTMLDLVRVILRLAAGNTRDSALLVLEGTSITIEAPTPALLVLIDGEERLLPTPLHVTIQPRGLRVFAPAQAA
jgi:diacylglycerol kinase family enzyme